MPKLICDESYWRFRAEEARTIASELTNPECKQIMVGIAQSYEQLAELSHEFRSAAVTVGRNLDQGSAREPWKPVSS